MRTLNEVVIVAYGRSPIGKAVRGALAVEHPSKIGAEVLKAVLAKVDKLPHDQIDDVIVGCAFPEDVEGLNFARVMSQRLGLPDSVPAETISRFSGSGLQSIILGANAIMSGQADVIVAGGIDVMSTLNVDVSSADPFVADRADQLLSMARRAEALAVKSGLTRGDLDAYAVNSHKKAAKAQGRGEMSKEIVPVTYTDKTGEVRALSVDENVHGDIDRKGLAAAKPLFEEGASVTAGNSAPDGDGAAFVVLMSAEKAKALGVTPIARFLGSAVEGEEALSSDAEGVKAAEKLLERLGFAVLDFDLFEIGEAHAPQAVSLIAKLGADERKVNPRGGAIAIGDPLGATGAIMMCRALSYLEDAHGKLGLLAMPIEGGMSMACAIERAEGAV